MSRFFSDKHAKLTPYVPGEQPKTANLVKLNTNESPFPPPQAVLDAINGVSPKLNLYSDPTGTVLRRKLADYHGVAAENISLGNGSDETLAFAFLAFADERRSLTFPDITYGFYPVLANLLGLPYTELPVSASFEVEPQDYIVGGEPKVVVLANPNAPTGIALPIEKLERVVRFAPDCLFIIDEAYADFWGDTAIPLTAKYDNVLVVRTYSKSRNLAGARLGYAVGCAELISDVETVRNSFNPYNCNALTLAAGAAALDCNDYYRANWAEIAATRDDAASKLRALGFPVTESRANFLFAEHAEVSGKAIFDALRERGILVRRWNAPRIAERMRITVGTREQMNLLLGTLEIILKEVRFL
ncbi:MAG: histidinol-phosphate transaminase [Oscillospiraceae bacterium]|jgi:histidinol-phosphate aminotransferase|nr:histidinol-phosphate transaminase [Oscillospiraceae bacterium]